MDYANRPHTFCLSKVQAHRLECEGEQMTILFIPSILELLLMAALITRDAMYGERWGK